MKTFENNEGASISQHTEVLIQNAKVGSDIFEDLPDLDINGDIKQPKHSQEKHSFSQKLNCPLDEKVKQKFQKMSKDGYNYEKLINIVPKHDENETCECGHKFDPGSPIKNYWIQSKGVRMHNTEWVPKLSRTAYYRPTVGKQCEHKDTWTGEDDMLLNIREWFKCLSVQFIPSYILICMVYTFTNIISLNGSRIPNVFLCNSYVHANLFAWF